MLVSLVSATRRPLSPSVQFHSVFILIVCVDTRLGGELPLRGRVDEQGFLGIDSKLRFLSDLQGCSKNSQA